MSCEGGSARRRILCIPGGAVPGAEPVGGPQSRQHCVDPGLASLGEVVASPSLGSGLWAEGGGDQPDLSGLAPASRERE